MRSFMDDVRYEMGGRRLVLTLLRSSGMEKRRLDRLAFEQPLRIVPVDEEAQADWNAAYEAVSRNISRDGLTLLQAKLATTQRILIGLPAGNQVEYLPAEIRHCRAVTGEIVELGCRFQSAEPDEPEPALGPVVDAVHQAVEALLEEIQQSLEKPEEKRIHTRLNYHGQVSVRTSGQPAITGFARNLSKSGIGFLTTTPVSCAEHVLFLSQARGPALGTRARVVRCTRIKEGLYDIGAVFIALEPPAPGESKP
jgi:hypothetical protein